MTDPPLDNSCLIRYIQRWQAGDRTAADELLRATGQRLEKLARRMYRTFPNIHNEADSGDVFQNSIIRLLTSLKKLQPASTRDFFNLAAVHIRRELLDLARRCRHKTTLRFGHPDDSDSPRPHPVVPMAIVPSDDFELWVRFHQAVDRLPVSEREVVGLIFYHGWNQARIAELFGVDERTIRRRWTRACQRLRHMVGDELPDTLRG
ncbi:MAG: sigma-70 family RNA polymerase sigma factor [Gemmataceae bacterium]|nr:sigma-70 family RNA polymerase sigma factor [Gemmata sp.]MDW8196669.1 sigma-70 family RNA polymerase sigma factor [Gemmataceae bacterium]